MTTNTIIQLLNIHTSLLEYYNLNKNHKMYDKLNEGYKNGR
jgi:hypothetical protein